MSTFLATLTVMRADRLVAALLLMHARGRVTAADLADELEVSVAAARHDLKALSARRQFPSIRRPDVAAGGL